MRFPTFTPVAWAAALVFAASTVAACSTGGDPTSEPGSSQQSLLSDESTGSQSADPPTSVQSQALAWLEPAIDGHFSAAGDYQLALRCWGEGSPTIVYDAGTGTSGIAQAQGSPITRGLAAQTRVCSYDRAGIGASDPAPLRKRYLDDVVDDLHAVLLAADVDPPYLLVGSSGGGFDVYHHTGRYRDDVVGLVMLDVPAGQAHMSRSDVPAWDSAENPEHMDYVAVEHQMAVDRLPIPAIPVTVVTAAQGQSADPKEQRVWLKGSSDPKQVVVESGHDVFYESPDDVLQAILAILDVVEAARE